MVCERHFTFDDIVVKNGIRFFRPNAFPTIFVYPLPLTTDDSMEMEITSGNEKKVCSKFQNCDISKMTAGMDESLVICKKCIDLNIQLIKASNQIALLKEKNSMLKVSLTMERKAIDDCRKEITNLKRENSEIRSAIDVC